MGRFFNTEIFIDEVKKVHGNKYDYSLVEYKNYKIKIDIICPIHGQFKQAPEKHLSGQGCNKCGKEISKNSKRKTQDEFIKQAKKIHGNKYDYSLIQYINVQTKVKIICPIHGIWEQKPNKHLSGQGCRKCSGSFKLNTEVFIKKANQIHNNKYDYSLVEYKDHYSKVKIGCLKHGQFIQGAGSHLSGVGCPSCNESKGEKTIFNFLVKNKIPFERQKEFNNCVYKGRLKFDFYLSKRNICIEYNGLQHYEPIPAWGGKENYEQIIKRDNIKRKYCQKNGIQLITIKFNEDIIEVLTCLIK